MRIRKTFAMGAIALAGGLLTASSLAAQQPPPAIKPAEVVVTVKLADKNLATAVHEVLRNDPFTFPYVIDVSAVEGKVTLEGKVDTDAAKARVEQVASSVTGVKDIDDRLVVQPNLFDKTDMQIKESVESELGWSPLVRNRQIIVQVADGIVTLHGEVKDLRAWHSATANAIQGGAKKVVNKLTIKPSPNMNLPSPWASLLPKPHTADMTVRPLP